METPHYIVSDVHLGAVPDSTERAFIRFLAHVGASGRALLIAGDLFDFWFEYGTIVPGRHVRVLAALAELVDAGLRVEMVGGNHDAWGGRYLRDVIGIGFTPGTLSTSIAGKPALVAHGDGLGRGDYKYRALKSVIRSRPAIAAFRALHPELGHRLARFVSRTEVHGAPGDPSRGRARHLESWAVERLLEDPDLGWVVCGHIHLPVIKPVGGGRYYLNAGDWLHHHTYIEVGADAVPELKRWPVAD